MKLKEIYEIGKDVNLSEEVVDEALAFFHSIGEILHFVDIPNIRDTVILNVAWLVDLFRIIITQSVTFKTDLKAPAEVTRQIDDLLNTGRLHHGLIDYRLECHHRLQDKEIVLEVMENYDIIYKMSNSVYYLPCQVLQKEAEGDDSMLPAGSVARRAIIFHFAGNFLPEGIFYRLVVRCLKEWSTEDVKLLKHQARIYKEGFHVTLRKRKADIELNILVSNGQPVTNAEATAVRVLVERQLKYLIKTYTPGLSFRLCVKCPCKKHNPESNMPDSMDLDDRCVDIDQAGHSLNAVCYKSVNPVPGCEEDMKLWFSPEYHVPRQQSDTPTQPLRQSPVMQTKTRKHGQRTQDVCHDTKQLLEKKARIGISQRSERNVSGKKILLVNDEWGTTKGGISTVNRQVSQLVAETQQDVYVTALEACKEDKEDAESKGIHLLLPTEKHHSDKKPSVDWLTDYHSVHFPQIKQMKNVKVVIGHMPITGMAALKIKKDCFPSKKVKAVLFNHVIPEDTEIHKDEWTPTRVQKKEAELCSQAAMADVVFSVGPRMYSHFENKYRKLTSVKHELFLPMPDERFFAVSMKRPSLDCKIQITTFGRVTGVAHLKGYDLAAAALSRVVESLNRKKPDQDPPVWLIRGIPEGHGKESKEYIEKHITTGHLQCNLYPYGTQDQIRDDLQQSHLCLMPSRSEPFGMVGLEAIATGVPVLLTKHSGLAKFLIKYFPEEIHKEVLVDAGLNDKEKEKDVQLWAEHIERTLDNYDAAFNRAQRMKELLKHSKEVRETHEVFKKVCCE
ncbi:uncharacterized protein [Ptychodera flava]|uniref:uncharacterized protein n=1 Tax=Ptychodera flava TaxID=63121 RepID=UPI003969DBE5